MARRASGFGVAAALVLVLTSPGAHADHSYIEGFLGWSKDGTFYVMSRAGTDEVQEPALCLTRPDKPSPTWPKDVPVPSADDDLGCTPGFDELFASLGPDKWRAKAKGYVASSAMEVKGPRGETVAARSVNGNTFLEVTVTRGHDRIARGYLALEHGVPDVTGTYWRAGGGAVAVELGFPPAAEGPGFGPPAYLMVLATDGSAANAQRPQTQREQATALNTEGMKLLVGKRLPEAQAKFVAATQADRTYALAQYNLASVASLQGDAAVAVAAILVVIDLARSDAVAKRAIAKAKTDHDLDFIAGDPYIASLLGRPRTAGDEWCIAAEQRARQISLGNFNSLAQDIAVVLDPSASHGGFPGNDAPAFRCDHKGNQSQMTITFRVTWAGKDGARPLASVAWELFPDGTFDADRLPDDAKTKPVSLKKLARLARLSANIAGGSPR